MLPSPWVTLGKFLLLSVTQSLKCLLSFNHQIVIEHQLIQLKSSAIKGEMCFKIMAHYEITKYFMGVSGDTGIPEHLYTDRTWEEKIKALGTSGSPTHKKLTLTE